MAKYLILKKRKNFLKAAKDVTFVLSNIIVQAAFCDDIKKNNLPRIGFTATKRLGKAYYRNLTKRRMRAICHELGKENFLQNIDYVLVGRHDTAVCEYEKLKTEVKEALRRVNKIFKKRQKDDEKTLDSAN